MSDALNETLTTALELARTAFQFYMISDVCIKDLSYDELRVPLNTLVSLLQNATAS